ncbi:hypothetical protein MBLNU230_g6011t1 [Neophaeotheca triangularis]
MAILSTFTLIRTLSIFHLTAAYFFWTAPKAVADQNVVYMLGESMRLPHVTSLDKPNEASAFIAVVLAFLAIADFTAASLDELAALEYWLSNVPVRLAFLFVLTGYSYLFKEDGVFGSGSGIYRKAGVGENLQNSLVFAFGFFETVLWFWIFTSLRDDKRRLATRMLEKKKLEQDSL